MLERLRFKYIKQRLDYHSLISVSYSCIYIYSNGLRTTSMMEPSRYSMIATTSLGS